jgi:hypothetical protein
LPSWLAITVLDHAQIQFSDEEHRVAHSELAIFVEGWVVPRAEQVAFSPKSDDLGLVRLAELSNCRGVYGESVADPWSRGAVRNWAPS